MQDMHGRTIVWDPVSIVFMMWVLNVDMPVARLHVQDVVAANRHNIAVAHEANACTMKK